MNKPMVAGVALLFAAGAFAQTSANGQVDASASQNSSVSVAPSGTRAQSNTEVKASQQTGVSAGQVKSPRDSASGMATGKRQHAPIRVVLDNSLDASRSKQGDQVIAKTTEEFTLDSGVTVPKGSKILGRVTQVKARGKGQSESALGIAFEKAALKDGREVPLNAMVHAMAAAQNQAALDSGGSDLMASQSGMASGAVRGGGGGLLGGVGSTVGAVTNTGANLGGPLGSATTATGALTSDANGVIGMPGLALDAAGSTATNASVITSTSQNVRLQSGTQMLLRVMQ